MNIQQPQRNAQQGNLSQYVDSVDRAANKTVAVKQEEMPSYGAPRRGAVASLVDDLSTELGGKISELRRLLDTIEQTLLTSAADAKARLDQHVAVCVRINDEIVHARGVIAELAEHARQP